MNRKGFTLIELLVVLAIMGLLALITVPVVSSVTSKAGLQKDKMTAENIEECIFAWMSTEYGSDNLYKQNLNNGSMSLPGVSPLRFGSYSELIYSFYFAGTDQLPGIESNEEGYIRHAVISAVKATSNTKIRTDGGEQFVYPPDGGAQYGFKYYYKLGRVNVERTDATESALGDAEVYKYYIWLDKPGGVTNNDVVPKKSRFGPSLAVISPEGLASMRFVIGQTDIVNCRFIVSDGVQSFTCGGALETPVMFGLGNYTIEYYYRGTLKKTVTVSLTQAGENTVDLQ